MVDTTGWVLHTDYSIKISIFTLLTMEKYFGVTKSFLLLQTEILILKDVSMRLKEFKEENKVVAT